MPNTASNVLPKDTPLTASFAHNTASMTTTVLTVFVSFVIVITLILLCRYGLKYLEPYLIGNKRTRYLSLVETLSLDQRRRVSLIRCGSRHCIVLTGGGNDVFLGWIPLSDVPPLSDSFAETLRHEENSQTMESTP